MVAIQFFRNINGQESLSGENLRTCTLEMMVDYLYTVNVTIGKLLA